LRFEESWVSAEHLSRSPWELPKSNLNLLGYEQTMNSS